MPTGGSDLLLVAVSNIVSLTIRLFRVVMFKHDVVCKTYGTKVRRYNIGKVLIPWAGHSQR